MGTRWANARWSLERWAAPFRAPAPESAISILWRNVPWATARWTQRSVSLPGAACLTTDSLVTVCHAAPRIQGGEVDVANEYALGNVVRIDGTFESDGIPVDPFEVAGSLKTPSGNYEYYALGDNLVQDAPGEYHFTTVPLEEGRYDYRIAGMGSYVAAAEGFFVIRESFFN